MINSDELQKEAESRLGQVLGKASPSVFEMTTHCLRFIHELILLERKTEFQFEALDGTQVTIPYEQARRRFTEHLKKIAELGATGWISVEDRFPTELGEYFLRCTGYSMVGTFDYATNRWYGGEPDGEGEVTGAVTHWMPIPELSE